MVKVFCEKANEAFPTIDWNFFLPPIFNLYEKMKTDIPDYKNLLKPFVKDEEWRSSIRNKFNKELLALIEKETSIKNLEGSIQADLQMIENKLGKINIVCDTIKQNFKKTTVSTPTPIGKNQTDQRFDYMQAKYSKSEEYLIEYFKKLAEHRTLFEIDYKQLKNALDAIISPCTNRNKKVPNLKWESERLLKRLNRIKDYLDEIKIVSEEYNEKCDLWAARLTEYINISGVWPQLSSGEITKMEKKGIKFKQLKPPVTGTGKEKSGRDNQ